MKVVIVVVLLGLMIGGLGIYLKNDNVEIVAHVYMAAAIILAGLKKPKFKVVEDLPKPSEPHEKVIFNPGDIV